MIESNKKRCKLCGITKDCILAGTFNNKSRNRFIDETGKQWVGNICYTCHAKRTRVRMRYLRANRRADDQEAD